MSQMTELGKYQSNSLYKRCFIRNTTIRSNKDTMWLNMTVLLSQSQTYSRILHAKRAALSFKQSRKIYNFFESLFSSTSSAYSKSPFEQILLSLCSHEDVATFNIIPVLKLRRKSERKQIWRIPLLEVNSDETSPISTNLGLWLLASNDWITEMNFSTTLFSEGIPQNCRIKMSRMPLPNEGRQKSQVYGKYVHALTFAQGTNINCLTPSNCSARLQLQSLSVQLRNMFLAQGSRCDAQENKIILIKLDFILRW